MKKTSLRQKTRTSRRQQPTSERARRGFRQTTLAPIRVFGADPQSRSWEAGLADRPILIRKSCWYRPINYLLQVSVSNTDIKPHLLIFWCNTVVFWRIQWTKVVHTTRCTLSWGLYGYFFFSPWLALKLDLNKTVNNLTFLHKCQK